MANIKSAQKRWRQSEKRRARNRAVRSETRGAVRAAVAGITSDASASEAVVRAALVKLDKAAEKGIIHKNTAARSKSRLMRRFNAGKSA